MAKRKRRKFTDEFKADAVKLCAAGGRSIGQVAADLDLTEAIGLLAARCKSIQLRRLDSRRTSREIIRRDSAARRSNIGALQRAGRLESSWPRPISSPWTNILRRSLKP